MRSLSAGKPAWLGLLIEHQPHWHTYWKNGGDSGGPTKIEWTLPAGVTAGEIQWPPPEKLTVEGLSIRDAAQRFGKTEGAIRVTLHRGLAALSAAVLRYLRP